MNRDYVIGFDGSSGRKRAGTADSTALVAIPLARPAPVTVLGYWEDTGVPSWEPPRAEVCALVEQHLGDPYCVGGGFDPAGWGDEIAGWQAKYGPRLRTRNLAMSTTWRARAWPLLREAIMRKSIVLDKRDPHHQALRRHLLAARLDELERVTKEHEGIRAERIDLAAATAYGVSARLEAIERNTPATSSPPSWPARTNTASRWTGESTGWRPVNVTCAHPRCSEKTAARFCTEDHLAEYRAWWPDDPQLRRRGKLVSPPAADPPDRLVATYGVQRQADTHVVFDERGSHIVESRGSRR